MSVLSAVFVCKWTMAQFFEQKSFLVPLWLLTLEGNFSNGLPQLAQMHWALGLLSGFPEPLITTLWPLPLQAGEQNRCLEFRPANHWASNSCPHDSHRTRAIEGTSG